MSLNTSSSKDTLLDKLLLKDKVFLITGASRGIGSAVAKLLSNNGATCILLARTIKDLSIVYDEIIAANNPTPAIYPFNLTNAKPEDYDDLRINIDKNFSVLDGVIHIAGQIGGLTPIEQYPIEQWFTILQTNLTAAFILTKALIPLLKRSQNANTIFTVNNVGIKPKAFFGAYAVANSGINALAEVLKEEYQNYAQLKFKTVLLDKVNTRLFTLNHPAIDLKTLMTKEEAALKYLQALTTP